MRCPTLLAILIVLLPHALHAQVGDGRIYVRRIEFLGTSGIDDAVLRQELRQVEGTFINTSALEESRLRLERLPFVGRAQITQQPVEGVPDQVDVLITITEAPAREYRFGGAYSDSQRLSGYGYFVNENLLGTGQRFFARFDVSDFHTAGQIAHTDRYARPSGVGRTVAVDWRDIDQLTTDASALDAELVRVRLEYGYPISERQSVRFGLAAQDAEIIAGSLASDQLEAWVRENGDPNVQTDRSSTDFINVDFHVGWLHDSRDDAMFPNRGLRQSLDLNVAVPGSEIEHFAVDYAVSAYWPVFGGWTAHLYGTLGYGAKYGSRTTSLAPHLNWFAGGPDSVRGFRDGQLGPKDSNGNPYGGNLFIATQAELFMPLPEKWRRHARISFFYDVGQVYSTENVRFVDDDGQGLDYGFDLDELRQSVGIAAKFRLPFGVLRLSYGIPLNAKDSAASRFLRDDIDRLQIAIGVGF